MARVWANFNNCFSLQWRMGKHNLRKIRPVTVRKGMTVNELVLEMSRSGVMGAGSLARSVDVLEAMIRDNDCRVFFGQAGAMVPGGMRNIIIDMLELGWVDAFVTTGATLTHDLVEALGFSHFQGSASVDDAKLHREGWDRMYDSYMPNDVYGKMEDFLHPIMKAMAGKEWTIKGFLWEIGSSVKERSILKVCANKQIPLFCPAISDSGLGLQVWSFIQKRKLNVSAFDDLKEVLDIAWTSKRAGTFYVGGGVPKNYIQQAMQFSREASYAVQITTDRPEPGGSSGAPLKEGISWGKLDPKASYVDLFCDATIALPIIHASLKERLL
ncbi:deoxyhypusine synthase family protein [Candidatus Woesearchaeota archaeon]|nr:deoxyhypusine synthase family protein [Candidatus Woesearchaeota archaeon]